MSSSAALPPSGESAAEIYADWLTGLAAADVPADVRAAVGRSVLDVAGLCIAARNRDYVAAVRQSWDGSGGATAFGHTAPMDMAGAALVNGTAAHGEDYDDTFEGTPVHAGAVVVPAVLAAAESHGCSGADVLRGLAAGFELTCRLALVAPTAVHRAGFHPTAVLGTFGAAAGVAAALRLDAQQTVHALGVAGSLASGIIEYLAEGTSPKRLHPGWAAHSGIRAAMLGRHGFDGPRTVFEGGHGFFFGFADHGIERNFSEITGGLGEVWQASKIAFKPYACGTMCQPFIDCAVRLHGEALDPAGIESIVCKVGEGTVHRLWEPLAEKQAPTTPYSAKFSVPYGVAVGLIRGAAGLEQFDDGHIADAAILSLAAKVGYEIDPANEYPANYSGHLRVTMADGTVREVDQPHLRGGVREPLEDDEIGVKFRANTAYGGYAADRADALAGWCEGLFDAADLTGLAQFRG